MHAQKSLFMGSLFQNKYRIETARYFKSDYNIGYFFVTFCTKKREHFLGEIKNHEMHLSKIGVYTYDVIKKTPDLHSCCGIDAFVVMPNHVHLLIYVNYENDNREGMSDTNDNLETNQKMREIALRKGKLSVIVGSIKSAVTRYANNDIYFGWQTRFHDHIIRNSKEYNYIFQYIENNVINWKSDCFWD